MTLIIIIVVVPSYHYIIHIVSSSSVSLIYYYIRNGFVYTCALPPHVVAETDELRIFSFFKFFFLRTPATNRGVYFYTRILWRRCTLQTYYIDRQRLLHSTPILRQIRLCFIYFVQRFFLFYFLYRRSETARGNSRQ